MEIYQQIIETLSKFEFPILLGCVQHSKIEPQPLPIPIHMFEFPFLLGPFFHFPYINHSPVSFA
jgi:hypothetical protein